LLLARGVVLLEGDTDYGAFSTWFSSTTVVGSRDNTRDAHNRALIVADSDKNFGAWVSFLRAFGIPWAILCDGPVLSPARETSLFEQLSQAGVHFGQAPARDAPFAEWKAFWEGNGAFTVADQFGGVTKNDPDKGGEIEAFFSRVDPDRWQAVQQRYPKSKIRAGYAFAEEINLTDHPHRLHELQRLWHAMISHLTE